MQHAHVKRKEKTMNRYMLEEFHNDPALFRRLAEREQARGIGKAVAWLFAAIGRAFSQAVARLKPGPSRWIERLG
jgi:hypothetical protein